MEAYDIPGLSVDLVAGGKVIYAKGHGVRNIETQSPVTANSIFHTASVSKLFTALAIMELMADGKLALSDKVTQVVPKLKYKDDRLNSVTIQQLLDHTSGLPDVGNYHWDYAYEADSSLRLYFENRRLKTYSEPGTKFRYSNLGYDLLGLVVEQVANRSFEDFVKERILSPAGVEASDFRYFVVPDSLRTSPHTWSKASNGPKLRKVYPYNREHAPSSTLNASAAELGLWMVHFLNQLDTSERKDFYQQMLQPSTDLNNHMGLGFQLGKIKTFTKAGHYGGDRGFRSYLFLVPEKQLGLVLLANCDFNEDFRQEILHPIAELMIEQGY